MSLLPYMFLPAFSKSSDNIFFLPSSSSSVVPLNKRTILFAFKKSRLSSSSLAVYNSPESIFSFSVITSPTTPKSCHPHCRQKTSQSRFEKLAVQLHNWFPVRRGIFAKALCEWVMAWSECRKKIMQYKLSEGEQIPLAPTKNSASPNFCFPLPPERGWFAMLPNTP